VRRTAIELVLILFVVVISAFFIASCIGSTATNGNNQGRQSADYPDTQFLPISLATIPTDDFLPLWVAKEEGIFDQLGLQVRLTTFTSGQEMFAAVAANQVQGSSMGMMTVANLTLAGTDTEVISRLGPVRIAIVAAPGSNITAVQDLAGVPVAAAGATLEEFIIYRAMTDIGMNANNKLKLADIQDLYQRKEALLSGELQAAVVPWTFVSELEEQGAVVLVDVHQVEAYGSTVLGIRSDWLKQDGANETVGALNEAWNQAAQMINANPERYRDLLIERADLSDEDLADFEIQHYAMATLPVRNQVEGILTWGYEQGYLDREIPYGEFIFYP